VSGIFGQKLERVFARFGFTDAIYSLKTFVAAMTAYFIALQWGMERPFWAVMTAYVISHPLAGAALSKALYRIAGTVIGAAAAVLSVPVLVNAPELLVLFFAFWLGLCVYISQLDRTPRSYLFLLAGYTAGIIGFPSVMAPENIFTMASMRVQEILLGIVCGSVIHGLLPTRTVVSVLLEKIDAIMRDSERWSIDALRGATDDQQSKDRHRLASDIGELHQLSTHLPFDTSRLLPRVRAIRALQDQLSMMLPLVTALEDRLMVLQADGPLPADLKEAVDRTALWISKGDCQISCALTPAALIAHIEALMRDYAHDGSMRGLVIQNMLLRLEQLVKVHSHCRALDMQIRHPSRAPLSAKVAQLIAAAAPRSQHKDHWSAFRAGLNSFGVVVVSCSLWIATSWQEGQNAALMASVIASLFGNSDRPGPVMGIVFKASFYGYILSLIYNFGVFPAVTSFPILVLTLAPAFLITGAVMAHPKTTLHGTSFTLGFVGSLALSDALHDDFSWFANMGLATLIGVGIAAVWSSLTASFFEMNTGERLLKASAAELAEHSIEKQRGGMQIWFSRMLDRMTLLAPRLTDRSSDERAIEKAAMSDLCAGAAIVELQNLRPDCPTRGRDALEDVLKYTSTYYKQRKKDLSALPDDGLRSAIDHALKQQFEPNVDGRNTDLLCPVHVSLIGLRRSLFPDDRLLEVAA
jgi:uncharacterized membrane protein YccC